MSRPKCFFVTAQKMGKREYANNMCSFLLQWKFFSDIRFPGNFLAFLFAQSGLKRNLTNRSAYPKELVVIVMEFSKSKHAQDTVDLV